MDYLHLHRGKWRVRRVVPPALIEKIGKGTLTKTTGTDDYDRAVRIARPIIREHDRIIARAAGRKPNGPVNLKHVTSATTTSEWYTPSFIFDALRPVTFDMDVCSPGREVTPWVPARRFLTIADDGLRTPWAGFCWMNPPYGLRRGMQQWLDKFIAHADGVCMLSANSYTSWWQSFSGKCDLVLHVRGYVACIDGKDPSRRSRSPSFGSALFAIGPAGVAALHRAAANGLGVLAAPVAARAQARKAV